MSAGILHMHYVCVGDTPMGVRDAQAYKEGSNGEHVSWTREGSSDRSPNAAIHGSALPIREGGSVPR
jgi:hypothetical protein